VISSFASAECFVLRVLTKPVELDSLLLEMADVPQFRGLYEKEVALEGAARV
jgi:hypothetical protein